MVLVVALHDLPKPCADLTRTMMLPGLKRSLDRFQLRNHPLLRTQGVRVSRSGTCSRRSQGRGVIKSTRRMYRQDYVLFLRAAGGKIAFLREYFDPVRAARALDTPILGFES